MPPRKVVCPLGLACRFSEYLVLLSSVREGEACQALVVGFWSGSALEMPRIHFPGALSHLVTRGNQGHVIFKAPEDFRRFPEFPDKLRSGSRRGSAAKARAEVARRSVVRHGMPLSEEGATIRIISARPANRLERRKYEEGDS